MVLPQKIKAELSADKTESLFTVERDVGIVSRVVPGPECIKSSPEVCHNTEKTTRFQNIPYFYNIFLWIEKMFKTLRTENEIVSSFQLYV